MWPRCDGLAAEHEDVGEEASPRPGCRSPIRAQVGSGRGRHERLDAAADRQHADQAERDGAGGPALAGEGLGPGEVAGLDPRPEQPQPDAAGDEDRGQLEQPVRAGSAPRTRRPWPCRVMIEPMIARFAMFWNSR